MKAPRLLHNIAALGTVQVASYLLPLITLPYVTRVLGVHEWGKVAFASIVLSYFTLVTNWGFAWSATRKVAASRDDPAILSHTFLATWAAQWFLAMAASLLLVLMVLAIPSMQRDAEFYLLGIGLIFGNVMFPVWFLNGLEQMKAVALIQISARMAGIPLIFILIRRPDDAPLMIAITSVTGLISGIMTMIWITKNLNLHWHRPKARDALTALKEGGGIFLSTIWISLYTTLTPTILGIVSGHVAVGYYALADRARQAAQSGLSPVSQALFPRMSHLFNHDYGAARRLLKHSGLIIALLATAVSSCLWLAADFIILLLGGAQFAPSATVLKWLAPLPLLISLSNIFGVQIMLPNHQSRPFNRILGVAGALSLCLILPLIYWKGAEGAAMNTFITECFVTLAMGLYLHKQGFFAAKEQWAKA